VHVHPCWSADGGVCAPSGAYVSGDGSRGCMPLLPAQAAAAPRAHVSAVQGGSRGEGVSVNAVRGCEPVMPSARQLQQGAGNAERESERRTEREGRRGVTLCGEGGGEKEEVASSTAALDLLLKCIKALNPPPYMKIYKNPKPSPMNVVRRRSTSW
jgi:hypothetical protein